MNDIFGAQDDDNDDEVADYDNYDDYDDEFSAILNDPNNILDKNQGLVDIDITFCRSKILQNQTKIQLLLSY